MPRISIWTLIFLFTASGLLGVIAYGLATNDLSSETSRYLVVDERTLPVTAPEGVSARLKLKALKSDPPRLFVETKRLPQNAPLKLWLIDVTGRLKPLALPARVEVEKGKARAEIRLPKGAIRRYGTVIGEQNGKTVFQAPLG